jgi:hypothetical protein
MQKKIILQAELSMVAVNFSAPIITDNPTEKNITAKINLLDEANNAYDYPQIVLWQDEEYDKIGQWTDSDVNNRILEILNS